MNSSFSFPLSFPTLHTNRLQLQAFSEKDATALFELRSDSEFMKYLGRFPMKKKTEANAFIDNIYNAFKEQKGISWKIALKGSDHLIGYLGFWRIDVPHFRAEIGLGLNRKYRSKGYMKEALEAALGFGFNQLKVHSVMANVDVRNKNCIRLLENCGFVKEAHFREDYFFNGKFTDSLIYCILEQDFHLNPEQ